MKQALFEHIEGNTFKIRNEGMWDTVKGAYNKVTKPYSPESRETLQVGDEIVCIAPRFKGAKGKVIKVSPNGSNIRAEFNGRTDAVDLPAQTLKKV